MPKTPLDVTFVPGDGVAAVDRALTIATALAQANAAHDRGKPVVSWLS